MDKSEFNMKTSHLLPQLHLFAMRYTRNTEEARDLVQDTLLKAIRHHGSFRSGSNLQAWLFTILKNTFLNNYHRKTMIHKTIVQTDDINSSQLKVSATQNDGEGNFVMKDIQKALKSIPKAYSVIFIRYFEGYKYEEIAEEFRLPLGTVKTRIHVARCLLKKYLRDYATAPLSK